jgi:hypothetical protein
LKQSGGSFSDKQQTALNQILNYFAGGLDYDALYEKLMNDDLFKKSILLKYGKIPKSEVQEIKVKFKDETGLSYEAVNSYLNALKYKKQYDLKNSKYGLEMQRINREMQRINREMQRINEILQSYKEIFNKEDTVKENGLDFDSILKALEQKKDADDAAEE